MSDEQQDGLLACFVAGMPARPAAEIAGVNRHTARLYYHRLRETIAHRLEETAPLGPEIDAAQVDAIAPLLQPMRPHGMRVVPLFGLVERAGRIHIVPIIGQPRPLPAGPQPGPATPPALALDAIVCIDEPPFQTEDNAGRRPRPRIAFNPQTASDAQRRQVIRSFWHRTLRHLRRFNGVPRQHLFLYLKECEWRFNEESSEALLRTLRSWTTGTI
jgi:transposase